MIFPFSGSVGKGFNGLGVCADTDNAFKARRVLKRMYDHVLSGVAVTFYAHGLAVYLDDLPDAVLGFWDVCESHDFSF